LPPYLWADAGAFWLPAGLAPLASLFLSLLLFSFFCSNQQATNKTTALPAVFKLFCIWCKLTVYNPAAGGYLLATASLSLERAIP
jgi:hypothetical protein